MTDVTVQGGTMHDRERLGEAAGGGAASVVGARLRELRVARGLTQRDVGGGSLSPSYVSLIESGKRTPTAEVLADLCTRLGTSVHEVAAGTDLRVARSRAEVELDLTWAKIAIRAGNPASAEKYARLVLDDSALAERDRLDALAVLAAATEGQGRGLEAIEILEDMQADLDPATTRELWLSVQVMLLRCYKDACDFDHAVSVGERAMGHFGTVLSEDEMMLVISLADAHSERGDLTRARMYLSNVLGRAEAAGSLRVRGGALWNASIVASEQGRLDDAVALSERALAVLRESDMARHLARLRTSLGYLLLEQQHAGGVARARAQLEMALEELSDEGTAVEHARVHIDLARCDLVDGLLDDAESRLARARDGLDLADASTRRDLAFGDLVQAHVHAARGDLGTALEVAVAAAEVAAELESPREAARVWMAVAELAAGFDEVLHLKALRASVTVAGIRPTAVGSPDLDPRDTGEVACRPEATTHVPVR